VLATRIVARGRLDYRAPIVSHDEIGLFTDAFNRMIADLARKEEESAARAREERERLRFLASSSEELARAASYPELKELIARLPVPFLASWTVLDLLQGDGSIRREAGTHQDPERNAALRELLASEVSLDLESVISRVLRSGEPEVVPVMSQAHLDSGAPVPPRVVQLLRELGVCSYLSIPIHIGGQARGVLSLVSAEPHRRYQDADLAIAQDYGRRAGVAIEKILLLEAERESRRRAQEAVRMRDEFLSIASHELRTPLTPLRMQLQTLSRHLGREGSPLSPDRVRAMVQISDRMVTRLSGLIDDLLDVSRINAGRLALRYETFNLADLAREVLDRFRGEMEKCGCPAELEIRDTDAGGQVRGRWDRVRMEQVLANLITNAMRYGPGRPVRITVEGRGETAVLSVSDQGIGVAPEDQQRIFQRFERAAPSSHYGGLGLGLYISAQIVEMHGGSIHVESRLGQGSRFIVELRRQPTSEEEELALKGLSRSTPSLLVEPRVSGDRPPES
jgi:signal transduction histidine kinase